jgi:hypothetical protein
MACEMIGAEKVKAFIEKSGKKKFRIWGAGEKRVNTPRFQSTDGNPIEDFNSWCELVADSTNAYYIVCFDSEIEEEGGSTNKGGDRKSGSVKTDFMLNPPAPRTYNQPNAMTPGTPLTAESIAAAIKAAQPAPPAVDIAAIVKSAVQETAHKYQIEMLNKNLETIQQNNARDMADMMERFTDMLEDEEEERAAEILGEKQKEIRQMELEAIDGWVKVGQGVLGEVKNVVYEFMGKNAPVRQMNAAGNIAVNGPRMGESAPQGWQPPISDQVGQLAPYLPQDKVNIDDQKAKAAWVVNQMLTEVNDVTGDDLLAFYKLYKDMPTKFQEAIIEIRKQAPLKTA